MSRLSTLHVLTSSTKYSHEEIARFALEGGARVIQLREKALPTEELLLIAQSLRQLTRKYGALLIINDRVDIAMAVNADGVHLGQDDLPATAARTLMPNAIIGVSTGSVEEALQAQADGADYIGFGHMYPTQSKVKHAPQRSLDELRAVARAVSIPVVAIGGITLDNVKELLRSGASGVAVIGAIASAVHPVEMTEEFVAQCNSSSPDRLNTSANRAKEPELNSDEFARYSRQLMLPEISFDGQQKLKQAKVCIVGAGGLGTPAAMYLASAGVGTMGLIDFDRVDITNLHRQVLYATGDVCRLKVEAGAERLRAMNPNVNVIQYAVKLTEENAREILSQYNVIIDGSDNFTTRYLVNDVAITLGKPVVFGAIDRFTGQVSVFGHEGGPCYRCLFPEAPSAGEVLSCAEAGVLGVLPGTIGMLQATEAVKLILGIGEVLSGRVCLYDAGAMRFREVKITRDTQCIACGAEAAVGV